MKLDTQPHPLESKLAKPIDGYRAFDNPHQTLAFRERMQLPGEVISGCE